ncbi:MAG: hypothetical protein ACP5PW_04640, partial [Candidatus Dormibacteria bacterium]
MPLMRAASSVIKAVLAACCIVATSVGLAALNVVDASGPASGGLVDTTTGETAYTVGPGVSELVVKLVGGTGGAAVDN